MQKEKVQLVDVCLKRKSVLFALLLIPFFELFTFEMMIGKNVFPQIFSGITTLFSLSRILITFILVAEFIYCRRVPQMITTWGIAGYSFVCVLVSALNGSVYLTYIVGSLSYVGLALLCEKIIKESLDCFNEACVLLFGFLSIVGALGIYIMPNGFFNAEKKMYAVYFLGSKNSSYYYFLIFMHFLLFDSLKKKGVVTRAEGIISSILLGAVVVCDSSNSLLCLAVVFVYYLVLRFGYGLYKFANAKLLLVANICLTLLVIFSANNLFVKSVVQMLGRDTTYTGRDVQWKQAIEAFLESPFLGTGIFTRYQLRTLEWSEHCHNVYLDILAKYGVVPLVILIIMIVIIVKRNAKSKNKKLVNLAGVTLFSLLLHNTFDSISIFFIVVLFVSIETVAYIEEEE